MPHRNRIRALIAIGAIILALSGRPWLLTAGFVLIFAWSLWRDPRVLRRIARPKFWVICITIAVLAGLLLGKNTREFLGVPISLDGLVMGLMMNLRAFTLIVAGAVLFRTVGRDQFMALTSRIGLRHLDPAFAMALEALPKVKTSWQKARGEERTSRFRAAARLLLAFADLAQNHPAPRAKLFAITGEIGRGKSTLLCRIADAAESAGFEVGGFFQERREGSENGAVAYELVRWRDGQRVKLGRRDGESGFRFEEGVFAEAQRWLREDAGTARLILIDELGKKEAVGGGHFPAVQELLRSDPVATVVAVLRKDKISELAELFPVAAESLLDLDTSDEESARLFMEMVVGE
ncbi:DUF2478 domain-containing protein [bacterium]|nr:DUF2478 domain-containing protein [bacterium]MBU1984406.1 DUF2478 domain-containing protein [bacterium]